MGTLVVGHERTACHTHARTQTARGAGYCPPVSRDLASEFFNKIVFAKILNACGSFWPLRVHPHIRLSSPRRPDVLRLTRQLPPGPRLASP